MISVITLTFNRANIIQHTIKSVLNQRFRDFEYIILDDGSTDETAEVVQRYCESDLRVKYFKVAHSGILTVLRNKAISLAQNELIAFIDSDDTWNENYLSDSSQALATNLDAAFSIADNRALLLKSDKAEFNLFSLITTQNFSPYTCSIIFRKIVLQTSGPYDEKMLIGDIDFFTRMSYFFKGTLLKGTYYTIHKTSDSISTANEEKCYQEVIITLEKLKSELKAQKTYHKALALIFKNYAYHFYANGEFQKAALYYKKSLSQMPFQPIVVLRLVLSWLM